MIALKVFLAIIVFSLPLFVGFIFKRKSYLQSYLLGQVFLWALFQVIAVPMINLRFTFNTLWISYTVVMAALAVRGILTIRKMGIPRKPSVKIQNWPQYIPYFIATLIITYQMCIYIFGMHLDEDDARWIAEANDALVKNRMYLHNPATGEYIGRFVGEMQKDVFSPWGMYLAVLSRLTTIRAVVIAHTI